NRRESRINFGWRSAIKQGQLAGENMAGGVKVYIRNAEDYFGLLYGAPLPERAESNSRSPSPPRSPGRRDA
ncbi:MAG: hypothetical protein ACYC9V_08300, partial [Desulfobacteria bacterium]